MGAQPGRPDQCCRPIEDVTNRMVTVATVRYRHRPSAWHKIRVAFAVTSELQYVLGLPILAAGAGTTNDLN